MMPFFFLSHAVTMEYCLHLCLRDPFRGGHRWPLKSWRFSSWSVDLLFDAVWSKLMIKWWQWSHCPAAKVPSTPCWRFRRLHWKPENSFSISVIPTCHHMAGVVRTRSTTEVPCFVFLGGGAVCRCLWFALPCKWQDCRVSQLYFISFCLARMSSLRSIGRILTVTPSPHRRATQALSWLHPLQVPWDRCVAGWVELVSQGGQMTSPEEYCDRPSFHSYRLSYRQTQARNRKERNWLNWNTGF